MAISVSVPAAFAAMVGHASFVFYFHRFECHMYAVLYLKALFLSCGGAFLAMNKMYGFSMADAATMTAAMATSFLAGAWGSVLFYRAFLNPLNKFPGPWPAKFCNLYMSINFANLDAYHKLKAMHDKYGRIVRVGSNDLSINDANIMETAYGRHSRVEKAWWYDNDHPLSSMHTTRDRALHEKRRKVWAPAFSEKALRDYETKIGGYSDMLVNKIAERKGAPIDMKTWFNLFSFDVMALLAFGKDYEMLRRGEKHYALELLDEGMMLLAFWFPTWFFRVLTAIPGLSAGYHKFVAFCANELNQRIQNSDETDEKGGSDMMSWILRAYRGLDRPGKDPMLQADARLIIVAGSDTTAAAFTFMFYYLAKDPEQVRKLREELRPLTRGDWSDKDINQAAHLNGCIYEALRLHPPVPSGVQRLTPPEGLEADGRHIPGHTVFWMPQYVMGRGMNYCELPSIVWN